MTKKVESSLNTLYDNYYVANDLSIKRALAAKDSVDHIFLLSQNKLGSLVDVGAGNGSVIRELLSRDVVNDVTAVEISTSGIEKINEICHPKIKGVVKFDGYKLPFSDQQFDTAICIHVLEHVEHERMLLREISRVAKNIFIEVPLEGGLRGRLYYDTGHINYYNSLNIRALIETSGLDIINEKIVTSSIDYESMLYGRFRGTVRSYLRKSLLRVLGKRSENLMTYLYAVHCRSSKKDQLIGS